MDYISKKLINMANKNSNNTTQLTTIIINTSQKLYILTGLQLKLLCPNIKFKNDN